MEDNDMINLWKLQDAKLNRSLAISTQLLHEVKAQKAKNALRTFTQFKTLGVMVAVIYMLLIAGALAIAIIHYSSAVNYFLVSMGAIFIINIKALADYIKHLIWIGNIDYDGNVVTIQQKLAKLQLSIINHNRIVLLQLPFWSTFFLSDKWFPQHTPWGFIVLQIIITGSFTWLAIWLYINQIPANMDKKWFKVLFNGSGGKAVNKAMAYYNEIEEFKAPPAP
jgi:hypothetical protein